MAQIAKRKAHEGELCTAQKSVRMYSHGILNAAKNLSLVFPIQLN